MSQSGSSILQSINFIKTKSYKNLYTMQQCFLIVFLLSLRMSFLACLAQYVWQSNLYQFVVNIVTLFPCTHCRTSLFSLSSLESYHAYSKSILTVFDLHHLASSFCVIQYQHWVRGHILPILLRNLYSSPFG